MKKDDTTRQKLAKVFEDFEAEPQPETWEHIRAAIQKKKKKRPFLWFFFAAGLVLLVGIGFYSRTPAKQTHANQPSQRTNTEKTLPMNSNTSRITERVTPHNTGSTEVLTDHAMPSATPKLSAKSDFKNNQSSHVVTSKKTATVSKENFFQATVENGLSRVAVVPELPTANMDTQTDSAVEKDRITAKEVVQTNPKLEQLAVLPLRKVLLKEDMMQRPNLELFPRSTPEIAPKQQEKKGRWTVDFTTLFTYQLTQSRVYEGKIATNIGSLPSFDTQRLGTSLAIGYQIPLKKRSDCNIALAWTNLPYRAQYDRASANQVQINFQSNNQYTVKRVTESTVNDAERLNLWGLQLQYGYTFSVLDKKIRVFAGGEGVLYDQNPEIWGSAGLNILLGKSKFQLMPVFKYQFKAMEQPDHLLQTKLYTVGLGVKRII